jgi:PKD repeat protein
VLVTNNNPAYPLTVSLSLEEGTKPLTVEFTIEEAGVSRTRPVAYSWDFGGNAQGKGEKAQHTYANSGEYFPVVTVKFSNDHIEIFPLPKITVLNEITAVTTQTQAPPEEEIPTLTPTITPTPTPVVTQIVPAPPKVDGYSVTIIADKVRGPTPLQVRFTSEAKGGIPLAWRWNFGDGQRNTVQKPAHNYGTPGTYVVQLSVQFGPTWVDAEPIVITVG